MDTTLQAEGRAARASNRSERDLRTDTGGVVYVEFLVAFIPVFVMILGMAQMALLYTAHLVVQHSAQTAARAAIVVLPDDPQFYNGAEVNKLADGRDPNEANNPLSELLRWIGGSPNISGIPALPSGGGGSGGGGGTSSSGNPAEVYAHRNARYTAIHDAASLPLMAISPSMQQLAPQLFGRDSAVIEGIGSDNPLMRGATGALFYNRAAMAVTFPQANVGSSGEQYVNEYSDLNAPVTVRVTYLFHCGIPIARQMMCDDPIAIEFPDAAALSRVFSDLGSNPSADSLARAAEAVSAIRARQEAARPGVAELRTAPWSLAALAASFTGQRFTIIRAQATLPLQGAEYQYGSGGGSGSGSGSGGGS